MGKGKAKGWRPPRDGEAASSLLVGSADHLTGDTIASPVQLREEGRAIPKGHLNYGDHWKGSTGKGCGKDGKTHEASNSIMPTASKASPAPKPVAKPSQAASRMAPPVPAFPEKELQTSSMEKENDIKDIKKEVKEEIISEDAAKVKRMDEAKTEIEKRREAMLAREKAVLQQSPLSAAGDADDAEARRLAAEVKRKEAEAAARAAETRRRQVAEKAKAAASDARLRRKLESDGADETEAGEVIADSVKVEAPAPDADVGSTSKRPRIEEPTTVASTTVVKQDPGAAGTAMQKGLQGWAARVNALADPTNPDMVKKCRDFVRQRILKAHASGDLHSNAWDEEPLPDEATLRDG